MSRMEDSITDGPGYEESTEQPEPSPEFERDTSLVDAIKDIASTDLSQQLSEIQDLIADLRKRYVAKRQG